MSDRRPFVGGNWKMHGTLASAEALARDVASQTSALSGVEIAVFPPFPHLERVVSSLSASTVHTGAQDVYFEGEGAFTGEVSCEMVKDVGATMVLTGHSERRHVLGESDELVGRKTAAAVAAGLVCVLCVGETLEQREAGKTDAVNERQLRACLAGLGPSDAGRLVIAYEPVWAIGTGRTATPEDAQAAHARIRKVLAELLGSDAADAMRVIYGGSVKPANAGSLFGQPDIDGGLIGGASLDASSFAAICEAAVATEGVG